MFENLFYFTVTLVDNEQRMEGNIPLSPVKLCKEYNLSFEMKPDAIGGGPHEIFVFLPKGETYLYKIKISSSQPEFHFKNVRKPFDLAVNDWNKISIIQSKEGEEYLLTMRAESSDVEIMKEKVNTAKVYEEVTIFPAYTNPLLPCSMKNFVVTSKYHHGLFSFGIFFIFVFNYFVLDVHR